MVTFDESATALPTRAIDRVITVARSASSSVLQVELGGRAIEQANRPSLGAATSIGLLAAVIVLLITFGSAMAAGLPIITALLGRGTGLGLIGLGSHLLATPDFSSQLAALLALGVGVEYGATVIVALLGLFILGITLLETAAMAAVVTVGLVPAAALTVLPILLARVGPRIAREGPRRLRRRFGRGPLWPRWSAAVTRHPWRATPGVASVTSPSISPAGDDRRV